MGAQNGSQTCTVPNLLNPPTPDVYLNVFFLVKVDTVDSLRNPNQKQRIKGITLTIHKYNKERQQSENKTGYP